MQCGGRQAAETDSMDLTLTPELAAFRDEVRAFLAAHAGEHEGGAPKDPRAWQRLLIEHGYAARTIPRAYGAPRALAGQGISMLVPTLLEVGSEEQKTRWIPPTLRGEIIWCQGYSEP